MIYIGHDIRWIVWKILHPRGTYGEFYNQFIENRINQNHTHPTLGNRPKNPTKYRATAESRLRFLQDHGLTPASRFLDYGCGSLRMGKLLIPYLDTDCYRGIDITDHFYKSALEDFSYDLLEVKRPKFGIINNHTLVEMHTFDAHIIYVGGVLHHVPPHEVRRFLSEVAKVIGPSTRCFMMNRSGPHKKRLGLMRWAYDPEKLAIMLSRCGVTLTRVIEDSVPPVTDPGTRNEMLIIESENQQHG